MQRQAYKNEQIRKAGKKPKGAHRITPHQVKLLEDLGFFWAVGNRENRGWKKKKKNSSASATYAATVNAANAAAAAAASAVPTASTTTSAATVAAAQVAVVKKPAAATLSVTSPAPLVDTAVDGEESPRARRSRTAVKKGVKALHKAAH